MSFASLSTLPVTRWRDVRLSAAARGVSIGGDFLSATALLLALQGRGAGGYAVAALLLAASAPLAVLSPLTGRLVDRVDSRTLITVVSLLQAICCVVMAYTHSTVALVGLAALVATGAAVTQPAFAALLPEMTTRADLPRAAALGQAATSVGMLAGPPIAGLLVGTFGVPVPLLLDGAGFLVVAVIGRLIATRRRPVANAVAPANGSAWTFRADPLLLPVIVMFGLVLGAISLINVAEVFFVRDTLHGSTTMYGVVAASWTGAMIIGGWLVSRRTTDDAGYAAMLAGSLAVTCLAIAVAGVVPAVGWLIPLMVLGGIGNGVTSSLSGVLISRRAPAPVRGRAFARYGAVANTASMIGYALGGALIGPVDTRVLIVGCGSLGLLVAAGCAVPMLRAGRRERARTVASVTPGPAVPVAA